MACEKLLGESRHNYSEAAYLYHTRYNLLRRANLRRDEIWFVERQQHSSSHLVNAVEFEGLRNDSSLQKLYEEGRLGGCPKLVDSVKPQSF